MLKCKMSCGPDNIPTELVKDHIGVLLKPMWFTYNFILKTNTFPKILKMSRI